MNYDRIITVLLAAVFLGLGLGGAIDRLGYDGAACWAAAWLALCLLVPAFVMGALKAAAKGKGS